MFFNSKECEWAKMSVYVAGALLVKITGIKYKSSKDKELLHAAGDAPISIQSGNRTYEGEIKILKGAIDDLNRAAVAAGGEDVLDMAFDIVIEYKPQGTRPIQTDTLVSVEVKDFEKGWDQGSKKMEVTLPILFLQLISE